MTLPALLLLALLPLTLLLAGYRLAAALRLDSPAQRLAFATLAGLLVVLLTLSLLNLLLPLTTPVAALSLSPLLLTVLHRATLRSFVADTTAILRSPRGVLAAAFFAVSLALLVSPELLHRDVIFYDGTGSHDGYFWISGAKYLQQHNVLQSPVPDADHPWANLVFSITGWTPNWGRASSEQLLAATASLARLDPVEAYLPATAALLSAWIAAVYLVVRTFWIPRLNPPALLVLVTLQPLFVFFRANGNLPNLLGALAGATLLLATARALAASAPRPPALALLALSLHALLASYPELAPFIAVPCALLVLRSAHARTLAPRPFLGAIAAGLLINPASTVRACHGFLHSFAAARLDVDWVNTFAPFQPSQYLPALATLSLPAAHFLGPLGCLPLSLLLLVTLASALRRSSDRFAAAASLSGGVLLLGYTAVADFDYGWQKSAQFAAVFFAAALPVAATHAFTRDTTRRCRLLAAATLVGFFALAVAFQLRELHKGAQRKVLTRDWLALRTYAGEHHLRDSRVFIDAGTFPTSFFYSMWAAYFLPATSLAYPESGDRPGGYLHATVDPTTLQPTDALLLGPSADPAAYPHRRPLLSGSDFTLLSPENIRLSPQRD